MRAGTAIRGVHSVQEKMIRRDVAGNASSRHRSECCRRRRSKLRLYEWRFLVHRALLPHAGVEFDLAEGALVSADVLLQQAEERLGLLRAEIDALEVLDLDLSFGLLLQGAEDEEEVPDVHTHLHAVGVILAILGSVHELQIGLRWIVHVRQCNEFVGKKESP